LLFFSLASSGQDLDEDLIRSYNDILDLKIRKEYPIIYSDKFQTAYNQGFQIYIRNLKTVLRLLLIRDTDKFETYARNEKEYYDRLDALHDDNPFIAYLKIELKVHRGLLKIKYGDRISGAFNLIQAFRQINSFEKNNPDHKYALKSVGLLNVIISLFPDKYNWLLNMMNVHPDFNKGIYSLKELAESKSVFSREAILMYALSMSFYSNQPSRAEHILDSYCSFFNNSLLYNYLYGLTSIKNRNNKSAIEHFETCLKYDRDFLQIPTIHYYRAESYLKELNYHKAAYLYQLYLNTTNADEFIKDSYYKLFNLSFLFNIPDSKKNELRENVLVRGSMLTGADRYAYQRISQNYTPNMILFKSRNLFDGGYFKESLDVLDSSDVSVFTLIEEKSEYFYRYARNYQELSEKELAIEYFNKVVHLEEAEQYYFWGNSQLNLGHIYTLQGDQDSARGFYRNALKYKGEEYKNSIKMEARTALRKLDNP
jgi:tetratricopeptide (TPR) repeat protein